MFNGLTFDRRYATFLLSSCCALVACADAGTAEKAAPYSAPILAHEGQEGVHDHPVASPWDGGVQTVPAPPGCAPNTFDAIQAQVFDSPTYGCTQGGCHGAGNAGLDLRANASYAALLGLPVMHHEEGAAHAEAGEAHEHEGDHDAAHEEGEVHEHEGDHDAAHEEGGGHTHAHLVPGNPEASVLYDRLRAGVQGSTPLMGGLAMPLGKPAITRDLLNAVGAWIRAGAPQTGFVVGTEAALCKKPLSAGTRAR